jgi:hypothetical protein
VQIAVLGPITAADSERRADVAEPAAVERLAAGEAVPAEVAEEDEAAVAPADAEVAAQTMPADGDVAPSMANSLHSAIEGALSLRTRARSR